MPTLSDAFLRSSKRRAGEEFYDDNGLVIRMGKKRSQWSIRFRPAGTKTYKREPIGYYPAMPIKEAREVADRFQQRLLSNIPTNLAPAVKPGTVLTLGNLMDRYEQARRHDGLKTFEASMRILRRGFADFANIDMRAFTKQDMRAAHSAMADGGRLVNGNRFLAYASALFNWGIDEDLIETNWARGKGGAVKRVKEKKRERVLRLEELTRVWLAAEQYAQIGNPQGAMTRRNFARMIRFLMLTGQRLGDAQNLRYGDIVANQWVQKDNKAGRRHSLRLPPQAIDEVEMHNGKLGALVFGSGGGTGTKITNIKIHIDRLRDLAGLEEHWTIHDLRRSASTHMGEAGVPLEVTEAILNHKLQGVVAVYQRAQYEQPKQEALQNWADKVEALVVQARRAA